MKINIIVKLALFVGVLTLFIQSCVKDNYYVIPPPHTPVSTSTLEAQHVSCANAPKTLTSAFWKTADYLKVDAKDVSTNYLFGDGLLNMTGTFSGRLSFNGGADPGLTLKAAYCDENLYILAEWTDNDMNLSEANWLWNGPADPRKSDSTGSWSSQRNSDKIALAFEIQNANSSTGGNFSDVGCAASCHVNGNNSVMHPDAGKVDIWNWSLSRSAPLGYLRDMVADGTGFSDDAGQSSSARNVAGSTDRSGPAYEWDGTNQNITLPSGQSAVLDPAFYLLNKTAMTGDASSGDKNYHFDFTGSGGCAHCHGEHGEGGDGPAINQIAYNKKSRAWLLARLSEIPDMAPYWSVLNPIQQNDIITYLRGLSGTPGYYLTLPTGSCADITCISNVSPIQISNAMATKSNVHSKYQVLIIRKLKTANTDDIQFDLSAVKMYKFGVALMNNDSRNHIGSTLQTLTFK